MGSVVLAGGLGDAGGCGGGWRAGLVGFLRRRGGLGGLVFDAVEEGLGAEDLVEVGEAVLADDGAAHGKLR